MGIFAAHLPEAAVGVVFAALIAGNHAGGHAGGAHDDHKAFGVVFAEAAAVVEHEVVDAVGAAVEWGIEGVGEGLVAVVGQGAVDEIDGVGGLAAQLAGERADALVAVAGQAAQLALARGGKFFR